MKKEFLHKDRGRRPEHGSLRGLLPVTNSWGLSRLVAKGTQPRPPQAAQRHPGGCRTGRGARAGGTAHAASDKGKMQPQLSHFPGQQQFRL